MIKVRSRVQIIWKWSHIILVIIFATWYLKGYYDQKEEGKYILFEQFHFPNFWWIDSVNKLVFKKLSHRSASVLSHLLALYFRPTIKNAVMWSDSIRVNNPGLNFNLFLLSCHNSLMLPFVSADFIISTLGYYKERCYCDFF